jgi:putative transcriptional regulator
MQRDNEKRPRTVATAGGRTQEDEAPMPTETLGRRATEGAHPVAKARKRAGLTQPQLAEKVGAGRATIARIEAGETSRSVALALAISREVGESVEALFGGR